MSTVPTTMDNGRTACPMARVESFMTMVLSTKDALRTALLSAKMPSSLKMQALSTKDPSRIIKPTAMAN